MLRVGGGGIVVHLHLMLLLLLLVLLLLRKLVLLLLLEVPLLLLQLLHELQLLLELPPLRPRHGLRVRARRRPGSLPMRSGPSCIRKSKGLLKTTTFSSLYSRLQGLNETKSGVSKLWVKVNYCGFDL
jgi:hypothetical protein